MKKAAYELLKTKYSDVISLEQLYKICHVAKRTAKYLLENKIIPCKDTGRKTWRYEIAIDDVIAYLHNRDANGSMVPTGAVNSKKCIQPRSFSRLILSGAAKEPEIASYIKHVLSVYPDVLNVAECSAMTGLNAETLLRMISAGDIKSLLVGNRHMIPKPYLMQFVTSQRFLNISGSSKQFIKLVGGFQKWKAAK